MGRTRCIRSRLHSALITSEVQFNIFDENETEELVNYLGMLP